MDAMICLKDRLFKTMRDADSIAQTYEAIDKVLLVLEFTQDLFYAEGYLYKAIEICQSCIGMIDGFLREGPRHSTEFKLQKYRQRVIAMQYIFINLKDDKHL
jgi:hypothetical protein